MPDMALTLRASSSAPGEARERVQAWLRDSQCDADTVDTAILLVSELVTNVVRHTPSNVIHLTGTLTNDRVSRISVDDLSRFPPVAAPHPPGPERIGGRGLFLVESMSRQWGSDRTDAGKRVWFELDC